ncbi:hypothetical protein D9756_007995 [Leucocoprinus leucothites]|uniref:F-box domain-containing protein n=1 Tax=Leucocoprinus leucothites TaxID=201217 RepID=A0A8H5D6A6_9AGAR|nr:hypothetical protein D9756_007995 [Leucoagaricus leucothites]
MHGALHIDEILMKIFEDPNLECLIAKCTQIEPSESEVYQWHSKPTLLAIASTCKTFYELASRVLWRQVDGLHRLLRLMPEHVVKAIDLGPGQRENAHITTGGANATECRQTTRRTEQGRCIVFLKNPSEEDWKTFDRFASYVRALGPATPQQSQLKLGDNVLSTLRARFCDRGIPILPQLRKLYCRTCEEYRYGSLLLSPQLHTLQLCFLYPTPCFTCLPTFIRDTTRFSSTMQLDHIHLFAVANPHERMRAQVSDLLTRTTVKLKTLVAPGFFVDSSVASAVLRSPELEELVIGFSPWDIQGMIGEEIKHPLLKRINVVHIPSEWKETLVERFYSDWIERLHAPGLVDVQIKGGPYQHTFTADIKRFLQLLSISESFADERQAWRKPCISLAPDTQFMTPFNLNDNALTFFNSLYVLCEPSNTHPTRSRFAELRILNMYNVPVDLADEEIGALGRALPQLRELMFSSDGQGREKSRTTLVALWLLAKYCNRIEAISLLIDASFDWRSFAALVGPRDNVPDNGESSGPFDWAKVHNTNLHSLVVGDSTIQNESFVSDFLNAIFPHIVNLCYTRSREATEETEKWRTVRYQLM